MSERADNIIKKLKSAGMTQTQLASRLGVSLGTVCRTIWGTRSTVRIASAVAEAVGESLESLFPEIAEREKRKAAARHVFLDRPNRAVIDPIEIKYLRKLVRHRLVDLDLDRPGSYRVVMKHLPRPVTLQIFSMTMTGYRCGPTAKQLLLDILGVLDRFSVEGTFPFYHERLDHYPAAPEMGDRS